MPLLERKYQVIGTVVNVPAGGTVSEALRINTSTKERFIIIQVDVSPSGLTVELRRIIGTRTEIVNPVVDSRFSPFILGEPLLGIRGDVPEKYSEGLIIPENSSFVVSLYNPTASTITAEIKVLYIHELYG